MFWYNKVLAPSILANSIQTDYKEDKANQPARNSSVVAIESSQNGVAVCFSVQVFGL